VLDRAAYKRLADSLPDIPRWIETRSMLLAGEGEILGLTEDPLAFVIRDTRTSFVAVIGRPPEDAIREALHRTGEDAYLIVQEDDEPYVHPLVPRFVSYPAVLHLQSDSSRLPEVPPGAVEFIQDDDLARSEGVPDALRSELRTVLLHTQIAAAIVDGRPVVFCYAGAETETLWDISIDTLEPYRRQGYAALAVAFLIGQMWRRRKRPVWGAEEQNAASMGLARKLGFTPVDRLFVLRAPPR